MTPVLVNHNQSECQIVVLGLAVRSCRRLNTLMLFYDFLSNYILYYVVCINSINYHTKNACCEQFSYAYILSLYVD